MMSLQICLYFLALCYHWLYLLIASIEFILNKIIMWWLWISEPRALHSYDIVFGFKGLINFGCPLHCFVTYSHFIGFHYDFESTRLWIMWVFRLSYWFTFIHRSPVMRFKVLLILKKWYRELSSNSSFYCYEFNWQKRIIQELTSLIFCLKWFIENFVD